MEAELLENLAQIEVKGVFYDIHNDYDFDRLIFKNNSLTFEFREINSSKLFSYLFLEVKIEELKLWEKIDSIDNLYRGRFEQNNTLIEKNEDDQYYFYLEFVSGLNIEFWAKELKFIISD